MQDLLPLILLSCVCSHRNWCGYPPGCGWNGCGSGRWDGCGAARGRDNCWDGSCGCSGWCREERNFCGCGRACYVPHRCWWGW